MSPLLILKCQNFKTSIPYSQPERDSRFYVPEKDFKTLISHSFWIEAVAK